MSRTPAKGRLVAVGILLLLAAVVVLAGVFAQAGGNAARLDPEGVGGQGSRALAELLRARGVTVQRVGTVPAAVDAAGRPGAASGTTTFLPLPATVPRAQLARLATAGMLVVVAPDRAVLRSLAPAVTPGRGASVRARPPRCALPAARVAGSAELGGSTFRLTSGGPRTVGCYPVAGDASLLAGTGLGGRVTLIGTAVPFTNDALATDGNAALALGLLGSRPRLVWLRPRVGDAAAAADRPGLVALLPDRLLLAGLQGVLAVVVLALWRARRLGPVVAEPVPVSVRSAEATEGRARLYRASSARGSAAAALRSGARRRLAADLGLPPHAATDAVVAAVVTRLPGTPPGTVADQIDGPAPTSDAALVRLAAELDALVEEVRQP